MVREYNCEFLADNDSSGLATQEIQFIEDRINRHAYNVEVRYFNPIRKKVSVLPEARTAYKTDLFVKDQDGETISDVKSGSNESDVSPVNLRNDSFGRSASKIARNIGNTFRNITKRDHEDHGWEQGQTFGSADPRDQSEHRPFGNDSGDGRPPRRNGNPNAPPGRDPSGNPSGGSGSNDRGDGDPPAPDPGGDGGGGGDPDPVGPTADWPLDTEARYFLIEVLAKGSDTSFWKALRHYDDEGRISNFMAISPPQARDLFYQEHDHEGKLQRYYLSRGDISLLVLAQNFNRQCKARDPSWRWFNTNKADFDRWRTSCRPTRHASHHQFDDPPITPSRSTVTGRNNRPNPTSTGGNRSNATTPRPRPARNDPSDPENGDDESLKVDIRVLWHRSSTSFS